MIHVNDVSLSEFELTVFDSMLSALPVRLRQYFPDEQRKIVQLPALGGWFKSGSAGAIGQVEICRRS